MSNGIKSILDYHKTRSFGSRENLVEQSERVRSAYKVLSAAEQTELATIALDRFAGGDRDCSYVLRGLACFQPGSLSAVHGRMIDAGLFYPGIMYYEGDAGTAMRLIQILDKGCKDSLACNHLLSALAWIGDANVQAVFARWRRQPPSWASLLHVPPHAYAQEAGWELTNSGERRNLFSEVAYPLVRQNAEAATGSDVAIGGRSNLECPWCNSSLIDLLSFTNLGNVLPELAATEFRALTCPVCTAYGQVFAKREPNGSWIWHEANTRPEYLPPDAAGWEEFPESPLVMSNATRHFMEATSWSVPGIAFSQVGGHPTWIQDAEYPQCPDCSQKMIFVGQISNEDYDELTEGIYYAFACSACSVSATLYQQS